MKTKLHLLFILLGLLAPVVSTAQDSDNEEQRESYQIRTIFRTDELASGGYAGLGNKFTTLDGKFANMPEIYGGWFVNHKFMIGIAAAATTNDIGVDYEDSTLPEVKMTYQYGQAGLMLEYTFWSHRAIHIAIQSFNGSGFTAQYQRNQYYDTQYWDVPKPDDEHDVNFFFVTEPGIKVELNIFKWMRFCPGVSYRAAFGSNARGLSDARTSAPSMNFTVKFGKF